MHNAYEVPPSLLSEIIILLLALYETNRNHSVSRLLGNMNGAGVYICTVDGVHGASFLFMTPLYIQRT